MRQCCCTVCTNVDCNCHTAVARLIPGVYKFKRKHLTNYCIVVLNSTVICLTLLGNLSDESRSVILKL